MLSILYFSSPPDAPSNQSEPASYRWKVVIIDSTPDGQRCAEFCVQFS